MKCLTLLAGLFALISFSSNNATNKLQHDNCKQQTISEESFEQDGYIIGIEQPQLSDYYRDANSSYNMVNYNLQTHTRSFEYFDYNSYPKRQKTTQVTPLSMPRTNEAIFHNDNGLLYSEEFSNENEKLENNSTSLRNIIGDDDRIPVTNPKVYPYKATAKLRMTYYNVYNNETNSYHTRTFIGSGFLEGPNLLVTAGHCAYGDVTNTYYDNNGAAHTEWEDNLVDPRFPDKIEAFFGCNGYSDMTSSYMYYAEALVINIDLDYYLDPSFDHDWSAIELNCDIGNIVGLWYGKIGNWYENNYDVYSWGYPGDMPATMCETYGKTVGSTNYRLDYDFDTMGGQSGSPVFMTSSSGESYVCGIHTSGGSTSNGGTRFTTFIYHYLNSFVTYHNYEHLSATIVPTDYGFADAYPTGSSTANNFVTHTLSSGFQFRTRRYRTGYIHNEYIVMSSIRRNINEAFIVYDFNYPVTKIEVDLSHWRSLSNEWTYPSNCTAVLRTGDSLSGYTTHLDLLASSTALPTDRNNPTTYTITFNTPVTSFEFYTSNTRINTNDDNRGRICIGTLKVFSKEGNY